MSTTKLYLNADALIKAYINGELDMERQRELLTVYWNNLARPADGVDAAEFASLQLIRYQLGEELEVVQPKTAL